ncbi:glycosyltransferase family 2 protein [Jeotgalibacillus malaysiensis]|uniref:glycosyltransferase family 2 protein n=1 Tax=Jeotgalibacillus malaysiensis TaxID=1508404 RepID=UPI00384AEE8B
MDKISVIVPVFNQEKLLNKCVDSLLNQKYSNIEIILVNDGSTDRSKELCEAYVQSDSRVILINQKNRGVAGARNSGIERASGRWIGFVDSDDWVSLDMYYILIKEIENSGADIGICKITYEEEKIGSKKGNKLIIDGGHSALRRLYQTNDIRYNVCNKLFKKELFQHIRFPEGRIYEDAAIMYKLIDKADKIALSPYYLYLYHKRDGSITRSTFSEKRFDVVINYIETDKYFSNHHADLRPMLSKVFFYALKNMITDIARERARNSSYMELISSNMSKIIRNPFLRKELDSKDITVGYAVSLMPMVIFYLYQYKYTWKSKELN